MKSGVSQNTFDLAKRKLKSCLRGVGKRIFVEHFFDLRDGKTTEEKVAIIRSKHSEISEAGANLKVKFFNLISEFGKLGHIYCLQRIRHSKNLPDDVTKKAELTSCYLCGSMFESDY